MGASRPACRISNGSATTVALVAEAVYGTLGELHIAAIVEPAQELLRLDSRLIQRQRAIGADREEALAAVNAIGQHEGFAPTRIDPQAETAHGAVPAHVTAMAVALVVVTVYGALGEFHGPIPTSVGWWRPASRCGQVTYKSPNYSENPVVSSVDRARKTV